MSVLLFLSLASLAQFSSSAWSITASTFGSGAQAARFVPGQLPGHRRVPAGSSARSQHFPQPKLSWLQHIWPSRSQQSQPMRSKQSAQMAAAAATDNVLAVGSANENIEGDRIVVCGAGIVGSSVAYHLAKRGAKVVVIEKEKVGAAASGKAGGFLARQWGDGGPTQSLHRLGYDLHKELASELGLTTWRQIPTLSVERERPGPGPGPDATKWMDAGGAKDVQVMDRDTTAQVTPREITDRLMEEALSLGAELRIGTVGGITHEEVGEGKLRVTGVELENGEVIPCDKVVVAMGPWSTKLEDWLGMATPMQGIYSTSLVYKADAKPEAGQMVRDEPAALFCGEDRFATHLEVYPRSNGDVYICGCGGSRYVSAESLRADEPAPGQEVADPKRVEAAAASFEKLAPVIAQDREPDVAQACMRPCPPDAMPMIGQIPGTEGGYIAAGHNCWGILWGPITGKLVSELILDGQASIDLQPFNPARFGGLITTPKGGRGRKRGDTSVGERW